MSQCSSPLWTGNFNTSTLNGIQTEDCYSKSNGECLNYTNCGICEKYGNKTCQPGDNFGPFYKDDCQYWSYSNYYDKRNFGKKITRRCRPEVYHYHDYETRHPSRNEIIIL